MTANYRMRWLQPYPEAIPGAGGLAGQTHRTVYPLLLERQAADGEWEPQERADSVTGSLEDMTRHSWWRDAEARMAERHGLAYHAVNAAGSRPGWPC
ncbi:hypothetical protein [Bifidobacterium myosotis]|uniref:Uncharacterized protein n=1 Tax=Bifidobacterium myosotis TaxID=1630166 RepID=A0A5M9ZKX1_9BIFI|nr:hypothetical protein [Bifidobacterium myosotis]KAA8828168.1 hypothetical protein EMO91_06935 [Bifidobacterium myosotis]